MDNEYVEDYESSPGHITALVNLANHDSLKDYWLHGEGAVKIRWGTPGDWTRCYRHISKHVADESAKRICAQWHHDATGTWPGDKRNK